MADKTGARPRLNTGERNERFLNNLAKVADKRMMDEVTKQANMTDAERMQLKDKERHEKQKRTSLLKQTKGYGSKRDSLLAGGGGRRTSKMNVKANSSGSDLMKVDDSEAHQGALFHPTMDRLTEADVGESGRESQLDEEGVAAAEEAHEEAARKAKLESTSPVMLGRVMDLDKVEQSAAESPRAPMLCSGSVQQERERGTKSVSAGFRKMVWKEVWLELRVDAVELFKTSERAKSHGRYGLTDVASCDAGEDGESPTITVAIAGGGVKTSWTLRVTTERQAQGWARAIMHNKGLVGSFMPADDAGAAASGGGDGTSTKDATSASAEVSADAVAEATAEEDAS